MDSQKIITMTQGEGRSKVMLSAHWMGEDIVVYLFNENAHIGAVAMGEYDFSSQRTSTSVFTRLGHKDDVVATRAAYKIGKSTRKSVCVIAGIHVDKIKSEEIKKTVNNADQLVDCLLSSGKL